MSQDKNVEEQKLTDKPSACNRGNGHTIIHSQVPLD